MMGFLRRINWRVALVCGLLLVAAHSSFGFAAEKLPPEKAYLRDVYKNMADVNSVRYDLVLKAETPMGDMKITANGEAHGKPLSLKQDINLYYRDMKNKENTVTAKQYMEQAQDKLVVYFLNNGTWIKRIMPAGVLLNEGASAEEKFFAQMDILQLMKAVKLKRETSSHKYVEITWDAIQLSDALGAAAKLNPAQDPEFLRALAVGRLVLLAAGDIKYNITIDKKTKMITEIDMDLTEPIRKGAGLFLDIANPKDKANIEAFLAKSTLHMQVTYSNYNQVGPIEIPQDVRDNAKEFKEAGTAVTAKVSEFVPDTENSL